MLNKNKISQKQTYEYTLFISLSSIKNLVLEQVKEKKKKNYLTL